MSFGTDCESVYFMSTRLLKDMIDGVRVVDKCILKVIFILHLLSLNTIWTNVAWTITKKKGNEWYESSFERNEGFP